MSELQSSESFIADNKVNIHEFADVSPKAQLGRGVSVGSGSVIGPDVIVGPNTWIGPNVIIEGKVKIGSNNKIFPGACIGLEPQDLKYGGDSTDVLIGDNNTFRECVTINRATFEGEKTIVGNQNLLMAYSHLGHNCDIGNSVVIANSVQIAGHVVVEDRAVIGGCLGIHQFVHIGYLAMIGGMTRVDRDVPPYCLAEGHPARARGTRRTRAPEAHHPGSRPRGLRQVGWRRRAAHPTASMAPQRATNRAPTGSSGEQPIRAAEAP